MKRTQKNTFNWKIFLICLLIAYSVAAIGGFFTIGKTNTAWYQSVKPAITPPNWVFPVVWNILFFLLALSLYFVWIGIKNKQKKKTIFLFFGINFLLNILWSLFYFTLKNPLVAFFDLILLWVSILVLIKLSLKEKIRTYWTLLPYLLWISFAGVLNYLSI